MHSSQLQLLHLLLVILNAIIEIAWLQTYFDILLLRVWERDYNLSSFSRYVLKTWWCIVFYTFLSATGDN